MIPLFPRIVYIITEAQWLKNTSESGKKMKVNKSHFRI